MFFFIEKSLEKKNSLSKLTWCQNLVENTISDNLYITKGKQNFLKFTKGPDTFLLLGDPILRPGFDFERDITFYGNSPDLKSLYRSINGHYYWFLLDKDGSLKAGTSFCALYPLFYYKESEKIYICSSSIYLTRYLKNIEINRKNILERLLFNYPLSGSTWWKGIHLLDTHQYLEVTQGKLSWCKGFSLPQIFNLKNTSSPTLEDLADLFDNQVKACIPHDSYAISLTGGFDGRVLVASALQTNQPFKVYCYGGPHSSDLAFSQTLAKKLKIDHIPISISRENLEDEGLENASTFMNLSEFNGNIGRLHYNLAARTLSKDVKHIITGNFGSELLRMMHRPGVMLSNNMMSIFSEKDRAWANKLCVFVERLNLGFRKADLESLIDDIEKYLMQSRHLSPPQRFYTFVYEELFRKYFGPELIAQSRYLNNRTPFLSYTFAKELSHTKWAAVHSELFEKNLVSRRKGQLFYSNYLRKYNKQLYFEQSNKGYCPADVIEPKRFPFLLKGIIKKKYIMKAEHDQDMMADFFQRHHLALYDVIDQTKVNDSLIKPLDRSLKEIPLGRNLDWWTKYYSIVYGFSSALHNSKNNILHFSRRDRLNTTFA